MQIEFAGSLRCLRCRGHLSVTAFEESPGGRDVVDGVLVCSTCQASYPIVRSIPRMLKGAYRMFPEFARRYRDRVQLVSEDPVCTDEAFERTQARTRNSFGYQWTTFSEITTDYRENFLTYLYPATAETFAGKLGLDVGCGFGRHLLQAVACGADMVGVDFSAAIESSYANTKHLRNVHLVQADIYDLPFAPGTFDFVYSIGVLHHLPDPEGGLRAITPLVKRGGAAYVWLYSKQRRVTNFLLELTRIATSRLPHPVVNGLSFVGAVIDQCAFVTPYRVLRRLPGVQVMAERLTPPRIKLYSRYPFQVIYADWFDRLAAPVRFYYSGPEVADMLRTAGMSDVEVSPTGLYGWRGKGIRWAHE
jgi:SAM-dependent methyltransferase